MSSYTKWFCKFIMVLFILVEIVAIEMQKFHYTVDILIAVFFVLLLWNSMLIELVAAELSSGYVWRHVEWQPRLFDVIFHVDRDKEQYDLASQSENLIIHYNTHKHNLSYELVTSGFFEELQKV